MALFQSYPLLDAWTTPDTWFDGVGGFKYPLNNIVPNPHMASQVCIRLFSPKHPMALFGHLVLEHGQCLTNCGFSW
jgi:hypothetical protein